MEAWQINWTPDLEDGDAPEPSANMQRQRLSCEARRILVKRLVQIHTAFGRHQASLPGVDAVLIIILAVGIGFCT